MDKVEFPKWIPKELYGELNDSPLIVSYAKSKAALFRLDTCLYMAEIWGKLRTECSGDFNSFLKKLFLSILVTREVSSIANENDSPSVNHKKMLKITADSGELLKLLESSGQSRAVASLWSQSLVHGILHAKDEQNISLWDELSIDDRKKWAVTLTSKLTPENIIKYLTNAAKLVAEDSQIDIEQGITKPVSESWRVNLIPSLRQVFDSYFDAPMKKEFCSVIAALINDASYEPDHYLEYWRDKLVKSIKRAS